MMSRIMRVIAASTATLALSACGKMSPSAKSMASAAVGNVGCKVSQSKMWDSLHSVTENAETYPSSAELREALLEVGSQNGFSGPAFDNYVKAFVENYELTMAGIE